MAYPITTIKKNPISWGNKVNIKTLSNFLDYASEIYYNEPEPVVDDIIYDNLWDILKERDPNNKLFQKTGAPIRDNITKVELPYWMGSMDKVKPNTRELDRWLSKYTGSYNISEKLDGLSGLITFSTQNDITQTHLYTRGDGKMGQDISHLIPYLQIPKIKSDSLAVRGEFIIEKNVFENKYSSKYPKGRSLVAGNINAKKPDVNVIKDIDFVAYEIVYPDDLKPSTQFKKLEEYKFKTAQNKLITSNLNSDTLKQLLLDIKASSLYEIDGIIVADDKQYPSNKSGNPKHAVAFKMQLEDQTATTTVEKVIWNPSKHGKLVPKVNFKPIKIGGDTIVNATAFNAKFVKDNKLGKGAVIKIIRSGDVIPYILEVVKPSKEADFPENINYSWNKSGIEIILDDIEDSSDVITKRLLHFFKTLKVAYLSEGLVKRLVDNGYNTLASIYNLSQNDLLELPGFKDKMANKIHSSIHTVIDNPIPLHTLMTASNIFGFGFGEKKLLPLVTKYPNIVSDWNKFGKNDIMRIEGFSDISADAFIKALPKFVKFLNEHPFLKYKEISSMTDKNITKSKIKGFIIVMTGFRDTELEKTLLSLGAKTSSAVSSNTNIVITKDTSSTSGKIKKAHSLGIEVISIEEFKNKYL